MKLNFLQVGFQKCGSTFLEKNVYPLNENLACIQAANDKDLEKCLLRDLIIPDGLEYERTKFEDNFNQIIENSFKGRDVKCKGIMFEAFSFLYQRRVDRKNVFDRLNESFPGIKIIAYIRNQKSWFLSHYSQYLKSGGKLSLSSFLNYQMSNPFLEAHYVEWYPYVKNLFNTFGKENVLVCFYEDLKNNPQGNADDIFSFLDIPSIKINPSNVNSSLSLYSLNLRRLLNYIVPFGLGDSSYLLNRTFLSSDISTLDNLFYKIKFSLYKPYTNQLLYKLDDFLSLSKKISLDENHIKALEQRYGENNRKLGELLGVDVEKLGYPIL